MASVASLTGSPAQAQRLAAVLRRTDDESLEGARQGTRAPARLEGAIVSLLGGVDAAAEGSEAAGAAIDSLAGNLYAAMREVRPGGDGERERGGNGRGNAYGLERGAGWSGRGWGSLAMRLELLAQRYAGAVPAASAPDAATAANVSATPASATPAADPATPAVAVDPGLPAASPAEAPAPEPVVDPLLAAYSAIVSIGGGSSAGDAAGLRDFLIEMAEGMKPGQGPTTGFVDLTA